MQSINLKPALFALALVVAAVVGAGGEHLIESVGSNDGATTERATAADCVPATPTRTP